jgi:hypothetical protein
MNQPKVIDADGHIYENHEGSKNTSRANIAACVGRATAGQDDGDET